jgi:hypothetical protein
VYRRVTSAVTTLGRLSPFMWGNRTPNLFLISPKNHDSPIALHCLIVLTASFEFNNSGRGDQNSGETPLSLKLACHNRCRLGFNALQAQWIRWYKGTNTPTCPMVSHRMPKGRLWNLGPLNSTGVIHSLGLLANETC